jgi:hypothetical protein
MLNSKHVQKANAGRPPTSPKGELTGTIDGRFSPHVPKYNRLYRTSVGKNVQPSQSNVRTSVYQATPVRSLDVQYPMICYVDATLKLDTDLLLPVHLLIALLG